MKPEAPSSSTYKSVKEVQQNAQTRMDKALADLQHEMSGIRTGRASVSVFDNLKVDYYGTPTPINQVATLHVPESAPFFADHFPRRAVFPATLLLDSQIRLALRLAADADDLPDGTKLVPVRMTHVKMRSFIAPGDVLDLGAEWAPSTDGVRKILLSAQGNGKSIATARLELASGEA